jgi:hypothetical protein
MGKSGSRRSGVEMRHPCSPRRLAVAIAAVVLVVAAGLPALPASAGVSTPAAAALTVTPNTLLLNNQLITAAGTGYPGGTQIGIVQCKTDPGGPQGCDLSTLDYVISDGAGAFSVGYQVKRVIRVGTDSIDCATAGACIVGAGVVPDGVPAANAAIQFDPSQPLPPPPSLTVDPSTDLVDRQSVIVTGSNFEPFTAVGVIQCRAPSNGAEDCDFATLRFMPVDESGGFAQPFTVRRLIRVGTETIDCAEPGLCEIGAGADPTLGAQAGISFDPDAPLAPPGTATVAPSTGLSDGQQLTVTGAGWEPNINIIVIQCKADGPPDGSSCAIDALTYAPTDGAGNFATQFTVRSSLSTQSGPVDCAAAPGTCMVAVVWSADPAGAVITPLSFGDDLPPPGGEPGGPPGSAPLVTPTFTG